jgi:hypothetical protein
MTNGYNNMTVAELERLLEVYGSDRTRWPAEARAGASQLVSRDKAARRLLVEAEALDRALERAPLLSLGREAELADRIAAAAQRSPRIVRFNTAPSSAPTPGSSSGSILHLPDARARRQWRNATRFGGAASLLAASLAVGVMIGLSSLPQPLAPAFEELSGLIGDRAGYNLAQLDPLDEDLL